MKGKAHKFLDHKKVSKTTPKLPYTSQTRMWYVWRVNFIQMEEASVHLCMCIQLG